MTRLLRSLCILVLLLAGTLPASAQPQAQPAPDPFVRHPAGTYALTNARVFDGTRTHRGWTIIVERDRILAAGPARRTRPPAGAQVIDLAGKTIIPGMVFLHEHLHFAVDEPEPSAQMRHLGPVVPRLLLAAGVTTARAAGTLFPSQDLAYAAQIREGRIPGPELIVAAPLIDRAPSMFFGIPAVSTPEEAAEQVAFWGRRGATWVKLFINVDRPIAAAVIAEARRRNMRVAGHLCALGYAEAAELGIDSIEHGLVHASEFRPDFRSGTCSETFTRIPEADDPRMQALIRTLVERNIPMTISPAAEEHFYPFGAPLNSLTRALLSPRALERFDRLRRPIDQRPADRAAGILAKYQRAWAAERAFRRAGGLLVVGTDTSMMGGCIAGPCTHRTLEMLVERVGFTPVETLQIATRDGARFLRRDDIGAIRPGIPANLVIVDGRPDEDIRAIRRVETVFRNGVGYDSAAMSESARGLIGN